MKFKKALYAGSFDPFTNGHLSVVEKGTELFDELVIGIAINSHKKRKTDIYDMKEAIREQFKHYKNVSVVTIESLVADYCMKHEQILCFYKKQTTYNPIMEVRGKPRNKGSYNKKQGDGDMCYGKFENVESFNNEYYPTSVIQVSNAVQKGKVHPTQKPVELMEYLIKTYTNEGEMVLDNSMGSGSTGVAAINLGRKFIGIELSEDYYNIAKSRMA